MENISEKIYLAVTNRRESGKAVKIKIIYCDSASYPPEEPKEEIKPDEVPIEFDRKGTIAKILINSNDDLEMVRYLIPDTEGSRHYAFEIKIKYRGDTISVVAVESDNIQ